MFGLNDVKGICVVSSTLHLLSVFLPELYGLRQQGRSVHIV